MKREACLKSQTLGLPWGSAVTWSFPSFADEGIKVGRCKFIPRFFPLRVQLALEYLPNQNSKMLMQSESIYCPRIHSGNDEAQSAEPRTTFHSEAPSPGGSPQTAGCGVPFPRGRPHWFSTALVLRDVEIIVLFQIFLSTKRTQRSSCYWINRSGHVYPI